ncbi:hypothetical protein [Halomarina rubra]|uniref:Uncharacterized protein n=1 Tax=Halomarina rubra TaxID=2071873 RepID=A0ABD6AZ04_9EURY|nr:hypothetical protein [Halomarina rubra]
MAPGKSEGSSKPTQKWHKTTSKQFQREELRRSIDDQITSIHRIEDKAGQLMRVYVATIIGVLSVGLTLSSTGILPEIAIIPTNERVAELGVKFSSAVTVMEQQQGEHFIWLLMFGGFGLALLTLYFLLSPAVFALKIQVPSSHMPGLKRQNLLFFSTSRTLSPSSGYIQEYQSSYIHNGEMLYNLESGWRKILYYLRNSVATFAISLIYFLILSYIDEPFVMFSLFLSVMVVLVGSFVAFADFTRLSDVLNSLNTIPAIYQLVLMGFFVANTVTWVESGHFFPFDTGAAAILGIFVVLAIVISHYFDTNTITSHLFVSIISLLGLLLVLSAVALFLAPNYVSQYSWVIAIVLVLFIASIPTTLLVWLCRAYQILYQKSTKLTKTYLETG